MVHALAITYARWFSPSSIKDSGAIKELENGLAVNVGKDLDWLEGELKGSNFLAGDEVTAADTSCVFSVQFIFARDLCAGKKVGEWPCIEAWLRRCEETDGWRRAVAETGHQM